MGNYHERFLGGLGLVTAPGYPVFKTYGVIALKKVVCFSV
jgi:hypothetical protein